MRIAIIDDDRAVWIVPDIDLDHFDFDRYTHVTMLLYTICQTLNLGMGPGMEADGVFKESE